MRMLTTAAAVVLLTASTAQAGVITLGTWSPTPLPSNYGETFFDHLSYDGQFLSIGWLLPAGTEYLHAADGGPVPFGFWGWGELGPKVISITGLPEGWANYNGDSFSFDNAHGLRFNSWDGFNMALFRQRHVGQTVYWLAIEDLISFDDDYNDFVVMAVLRDAVEPPPPVTYPPVVLPPGGEPPPSVPEPSVLAMAALGLAGWKMRRRQG